MLFARAPTRSTPAQCRHVDESHLAAPTAQLLCEAGHSRVWHDGHLDCLIGDELYHVGKDGVPASHGFVWNLDDLMELYNDDGVSAEAGLCGMSGGCSHAAPHRPASQPPRCDGVESAASHQHDHTADCRASSPSHSPTQFLHDGHVDYLVGNHLHHPTEGCHGPVSDEVLATVGLAAVGVIASPKPTHETPVS
jgi:hypothetical protein